ncbi:zinc finger MYM-type protein 1-like [Lissotriton helveticus]
MPLEHIHLCQIHTHYLGKHIQNELIELMSEMVLKEILRRVRRAKYYSVLLDCTPDLSHTEQMTFIVRFVSSTNGCVTIEEHFIGFIPLEEQTGLALTDALLHKLKALKIPLADCRGQGYDNGANMRGQYSGVQARILKENRRAFFTPCACHNWNLVLGDAAASSTYAANFFGIIQRLYSLFSASTKRWNVLKETGVTLSLKSLSATRWECRLESVKAVRFQMSLILEALLQVSEMDKDVKTRSEATSLVSELESYEFLLCLIIWYDILMRINTVSKLMQSENMQLDVAVKHVQELLTFLTKYRHQGFTAALISANELADELEIQKEFKCDRRISKKKKMFGYEGADMPITDPKEQFRIKFFNALVDTAIVCIDRRFEQLKNHQKQFGFLYNISSLKDMKGGDLQKHCNDLHHLLSDSSADGAISSDIDGIELFQEISFLAQVLPEKLGMLEALQYIYFNRLEDIYPNCVLALRILLTIPVTVASAEHSFSRLKLIKTYLRSTMSQERLSGLALLSIEGDIAATLDYSEMIDAFSRRKARKITF